MNWNRVTKNQSAVGTIGSIILLIVFTMILSWAGTAFGTYLICMLMGYAWT